MAKIKVDDRQIVVEKVVRQNYKQWHRGGNFTPAGYSLHFDHTDRGIIVPNALGMITTPDLLIGAFERRSIVPDGSAFSVDYDTLSVDEQRRMSYAIGNGRYAVVYDEGGSFKTMDLVPQWARFAEFVSNVSKQGRLKVICASYCVNHQDKEPDCYSLHADLMDFETFIKENGGLTHGYIKAKFETMVRSYAVKHHEVVIKDLMVIEEKKTLGWLADDGAFRRKYPEDKIKAIAPYVTSKVYHAPNQKQHFGCVYETVVDTDVAQQVLAASPGIFIFGTPPKGIVPVSSKGMLLHNPKDFCNL